jgi:hypothetical protein
LAIDYKKPYPTGDRLSLRQGARCLEEGKFKFKVFFDDIKKKELNRLIFCLRLNGKGVHQIGRGKPIGMGQAKVDVIQVCVREYSESGGKLTMSWDKESKTDFNHEELHASQQDFERILNYTTQLKDEYQDMIKYPCNKDDGDIYEWFALNRYPATEPNTHSLLRTL